MEDLRIVEDSSDGKVDVTVGSALDLFGGKGICYNEMIDWNEGRR